MRILVRFYGNLKRFLGARVAVELEDGSKMRELISKLSKVKGVEGALSEQNLEDSTLVVLVNGRNIHALDGVETVLKEGDFIIFMPVLVGG